MASDPETDQVVPLFHPHRDSGDDHITVETATGEIVGRK
jgi:hypothetical protein